MRERIDELEKRLAAVERQRCWAQRWGGFLLTLALVIVSVSLMFLSERFGQAKGAHPGHTPNHAPQ